MELRPPEGLANHWQGSPGRGFANLHLFTICPLLNAPTTSGPFFFRCQLKAFKLLSSIGFLIKMAKSQLFPTSVITYLCTLWDGINQVICPADKYINKTSMFISLFRRKGSCRHRDYQRLLGLLYFAAPLCRSGRLHLRLIIQGAPRFPNIRSCSRASICTARVSPSLWAHLLWWTKPQSQAACSPPSPPTLIIWTDASDSGWGGASSLNHEAWGVWSQPDVSWHINCHPAHLSTQRLGSPRAIRQHSGCSMDQLPRLQVPTQTRDSTLWQSDCSLFAISTSGRSGPVTSLALRTPGQMPSPEVN